MKDVRFFSMVLEAWSNKIVWNLFISCRLCINLFNDANTAESSLKCKLKSHSPFANKLQTTTLNHPLFHPHKPTHLCCATYVFPLSTIIPHIFNILSNFSSNWSILVSSSSKILLHKTVNNANFVKKHQGHTWIWGSRADIPPVRFYPSCRFLFNNWVVMLLWVFN